MDSFKCINHPQNRGIAFCKRCNGYLCQDCIMSVENKKYCKKCYLDSQHVISREPRCINHPGNPGAYYCKKCGGYLCQDCMTVKGDKKYCKKCYDDYQAASNHSKTTSTQPVCTNHPLKKGIMYCEECKGYLCHECIIISLEGDIKCRRHNQDDLSTRLQKSTTGIPSSITRVQHQEQTNEMSTVSSHSQQLEKEQTQPDGQLGDGNIDNRKSGYSLKSRSGIIRKKLYLIVLTASIVCFIFIFAVLYMFRKTDQARVLNGDQLQERTGLYYAFDDDKPYSGQIVSYYPSGAKRSLGSFKNGKLNGLTKFWYKNGQMKTEIFFEDNDKHGPYREWHSNGQKMYEGTYKKGIRQSPWHMWNSNGQRIDTEIVFDIDGNDYLAVKIGAQWWTAENLRVLHYRNGESITSGIRNSMVGYFASGQKHINGAYSLYNDEAKNWSNHGCLYNWSAVNDKRGVAPKGWHVASDAEWQILIDHLGGDRIAGSKMKDYGPENWGDGNDGATNESGLTVLGSGLYDPLKDEYIAINLVTSFWSSTEEPGSSGPNTAAYTRTILYNDSYVKRASTSSFFGASIRCVRD